MKSFLIVLFVKTELGKKSGSIHKKNIQKAFHQKYLTTKYNIRYVFKKNPDWTNRSPKTGKK